MKKKKTCSLGVFASIRRGWGTAAVVVNAGWMVVVDMCSSGDGRRGWVAVTSSVDAGGVRVVAAGNQRAEVWGSTCAHYICVGTTPA